MELDLNSKASNLLDWVCQLDLLLVHISSGLFFNCFRNVLVGNGAEELSALSSLNLNYNGLCFQFSSNLLSLCLLLSLLLSLQSLLFFNGTDILLSSLNSLS